MPDLFAAVCHFNLQDLFAVNGHGPATDVIKPDGAALNSSADAQIVQDSCPRVLISSVFTVVNNHWAPAIQICSCVDIADVLRICIAMGDLC